MMLLPNSENSRKLEDVGRPIGNEDSNTTITRRSEKYFLQTERSLGYEFD
jgi:hypothetical protein